MIIINVEPMEFTKEHRNFEDARGRVFPKVPPWKTTKAHVNAVEQVMRALKVPKGWPPLFESLDAISTLKLDQTLALAGDMGRYLLEALNIHPVIGAHMQAYLRALQDCQQKTPVKQVDEVMSRFREAAAALEALLPAFWNSITKHYATHLDRFQRLWGCFWACNELIHERINGKMKRLAKHGVRDRMSTLANNWDIFQEANNWLLEDDQALSYEAS